VVASILQSSCARKLYNMKQAVLILLSVLILGCLDKQKKQNDSIVGTHGKIELNGIQFNYVRQGSGDHAIVIGSSVYYPKAFSDSLKSKFDMIFVDSRHFLPNYNPSDKELAALNLTTWAEDIEAARIKLNLGKIILIGHSVHAQIALEYATMFPDNINELILICGVPYSFEQLSAKANEYWEKEADDSRKATLKLRLLKQDSIMQATPANKQFSVSYDLNAPLYWVDSNYDASDLLSGLLTSPKAFGKLFNSVPTKQEVISKLQNLKMPTLVISGKLDFACPHTEWEEVIKNTSIDYKLMTNASHNPHTEKITQKEFDKNLMTWISRHK